LHRDVKRDAGMSGLVELEKSIGATDRHSFCQPAVSLGSAPNNVFREEVRYGRK